MPDDNYPPPAPRPYPGDQYGPPRTRLPRLTWLLVLLLIIWLLPVVAERVEFARVRGKERAEAEVAAQELPTQYLSELSHAFGMIAKRIGPSVTHIETVRSFHGSGQDADELAALFGRQPLVQRGEGSGVIVDPDGYVLTNNHVVANAQQIEVRLSDGRNVSGRIVGIDPATDLAVLKIDAGDLIAAAWGDSDALDVGAMVWAIGNPFGLDRSITFGIVSAKNRRGFQHNPFQDFLQTDAAVNPGNSGGPLVNIKGELVGINTAIIGNAYQGISFAIPSSAAREVYEKLKKTGKVARAWLGVALMDLTPELAQRLSLPSLQGALVQRVQPGAPASKAGVKEGDVIVEWNSQPVENSAALSLLIAKSEIGTTAKMVVIRDGQKVTLDAPVEERPEQITH